MNRKLENVIGFFMNLPIARRYYGVDVKTHHYRCKLWNNKYKKSTFDEFKKEFNSTKDLYFHKEAEYSLFSSDFDTNRLDGDIMRLNGVGHMLTSYGLYRANRLIAKKIKELKKLQ